MLEPTFEVTLAEGVLDAVSKLEGASYDAIVSDDKMPDGRGRALLASVRDRFPLTRRVLISGDDVPGEQDRDPAWEHFVKKPFRPSDLIDVLRELTRPS